MNIITTFWIDGNQDDPQGNPIPYTRTTWRGKWRDPSAIRYGQWKKFVLDYAGAIGRLNFSQLSKDKAYRLDVECFLKADPDSHGDPENIRKGIQDAIFETIGDQHVAGECSFVHVPDNPGVVVMIAEISEGVSRHAMIVRKAALEKGL